MLPKWIKVLIVFLIVLSIVSVAIKIICNIDYLSDISDFALILSLVALIAYAYYNYLIAKDAYTPSASFAIQPYKNDPFHFAFILQNHSKVSLNCWCKLNPTVYDQRIDLDKFYGGKTSFDLQPYGNAMGHFDIRDILTKSKRPLEEIQSKYTKEDVKKQLYFNIEFWYNPVGVNNKFENPKQPHFFDFKRNIIVADF